MLQTPTIVADKNQANVSANALISFVY